MVIIAGHYRVEESQRDRVVEVHRDLVERSRSADGCLDVAVTADSVDPRRVTMFEVWRDAAALDAWRARADAPDLDVEMTDVTIKRYDAVDGGPLF
jgi:quinol monooxygenase YgiN